MASKILTPRPSADILKDLHLPSDDAGLRGLYDKSMEHVKSGLERNVYETGSLQERRKFMANVFASRIAGEKTGQPGCDLVEHNGHIVAELPSRYKEAMKNDRHRAAMKNEAVRNDRFKASMERFPFQQEQDLEKDELSPDV